jgi:hypothetical protein
MRRRLRRERKRVHHADDLMARITAERLIQHLTASGFAVTKGQPAPAPITAHMPPVGGLRQSVCWAGYRRNQRAATGRQ